MRSEIRRKNSLGPVAMLGEGRRYPEKSQVLFRRAFFLQHCMLGGGCEIIGFLSFGNFRSVLYMVSEGLTRGDNEE